MELIDIPCITLHRPWAGWIASDLKRIETRTHDRFKSLLGRWIGIHNGQHYDKNAHSLANGFRPYNDLLRSEARFGSQVGRVLCVAKVIDFRRLMAMDSEASLIDCSGNAGVVRFGLVLYGISVLPKIKETYVTGRQGIFTVSLPVDTLKESKMEARHA